MFQERILNNKLKELCDLKSKLASRSEENKEEVVEEIKKNVDDLEFILRYFHYIGGEEETKSRELKKFTLEDLDQYNGENGMPAYVVENETVYDITDLIKDEDREKCSCQCHNKTQDITKQAKVVGMLIE
ncbi:hypothetical protein [Clostridium cibarium]|uniref:Uncharacterized protein n=1 Tax=Clostridium cibarium TaxID=2762247 RepID=A0ABR8PRZ7_9CLOT|nr:hypothetical protein [Clostridium cibarium]MBD7910952.1 hypothetical protein [Clostridium cibarium]